MPGVPGALTGKGGPKWPELCIKTVIRLCRPTGISQNHHPFLLTLPFVANVCRGGAKIIVIPLTTCPTFTQFPAHVTHGRVSSTYGGVLIRYTCTSGCMDYFMSVGPYLMAKKRRHEKRIPKLKSEIYEWFVCYKNFSFVSFIIYQKFVWIIVRKRLPTAFVSLFVTSIFSLSVDFVGVR